MTRTSTSSVGQPTLPDSLRLGAVHLRVTDLDRSIPFYEESIGLTVAARSESSAALGSGGEDLLVLEEQPGARPAGHHAGLYHVALLYSSRLELARAARRLIQTATPVSGASDHTVNEAIYLSDPDDNGIELSADRDPEQWGDLTAIGGPLPLDLESLMAMGDGAEPLPDTDPGLRIGHVHLQVGDLEEALRFWRDLIGFEVTMRFPTAAFVSAGGYHHHLGFNTWRGENLPPMPPGTVGLRHWSIVLESPEQVAAVRQRVAAAGVTVEGRPGGFLVSDPAANAVLVRS